LQKQKNVTVKEQLLKKNAFLKLKNESVNVQRPREKEQLKKENALLKPKNVSEIELQQSEKE
jgi:hypothetical protein